MAIDTKSTAATTSAATLDEARSAIATPASTITTLARKALANRGASLTTSAAGALAANAARPSRPNFNAPEPRRTIARAMFAPYPRVSKIDPPSSGVPQPGLRP